MAGSKNRAGVLWGSVEQGKGSWHVLSDCDECWIGELHVFPSVKRKRARSTASAIQTNRVSQPDHVSCEPECQGSFESYMSFVYTLMHTSKLAPVSYSGTCIRTRWRAIHYRTTN